MEAREGYKKTKIGWIPEDWHVVRLGKITEKVGSGITPRGGSKVYLDEGIPFFRSQNILHGKLTTRDIVYISENQHQKMKNTHLQPDDVLLNITGASIGRCCVFPRYFEKGNVNQHVCIIRPDGIIDSQYLCFILNSTVGQKQIWNFQAGGNREGLNFQQIKSFNVPLAPLSEQQKIAEILTTVEDKISTIEDQIQQIGQLKKGLMEKLLTEGIGHTGFKDTKIGRLPASWDVVQIRKIIKELKSGLSRRLSIEDIGLPVLRSNNISERAIDFDELKYWYVDDPQGADTANYFLNENDILINFINSVAQIGKSAIFLNRINRDTIYTTNILKMTLVDSVDTNYIFFLTKTLRYKHFINSITKPAVNQASFTTKDFKRFYIPLPSLEEQKQIATILSTVDDKLDVLQSKKTSYETLKKDLMEQLLTGERRVKL